MTVMADQLKRDNPDGIATGAVHNSNQSAYSPSAMLNVPCDPPPATVGVVEGDLPDAARTEQPKFNLSEQESMTYMLIQPDGVNSEAPIQTSQQQTLSVNAESSQSEKSRALNLSQQQPLTYGVVQKTSREANSGESNQSEQYQSVSANILQPCGEDNVSYTVIETQTGGLTSDYINQAPKQQTVTVNIQPDGEENMQEFNLPQQRPVSYTVIEPQTDGNSEENNITDKQEMVSVSLESVQAGGENILSFNLPEQQPVSYTVIVPQSNGLNSKATVNSDQQQTKYISINPQIVTTSEEAMKPLSASDSSSQTKRDDVSDSLTSAHSKESPIPNTISQSPSDNSQNTTVPDDSSTSVDSTKSPTVDDSIDSASAKGLFGWTTLDNANMPYLLRRNIPYLSVRMLEMKLLSKYPNIYPEELKNRPPVVSHTMTEAEARLLNEINMEHCTGEFGVEPFRTNDLIVCLTDFQEFYDIVKKHFPDKQPTTQDNKSSASAPSAGWLQINNTIIPYVSRGQSKYVPLSVVRYAAGLLKDIQVEGEEPLEEECKLLNDSCGAAGLNFSFAKSTKLVPVDLIGKTEKQSSILVLPMYDPFKHAHYEVTPSVDIPSCSPDGMPPNVCLPTVSRSGFSAGINPSLTTSQPVQLNPSLSNTPSYTHHHLPADPVRPPLSHPGDPSVSNNSSVPAFSVASNIPDLLPITGLPTVPRSQQNTSQSGVPISQQLPVLSSTLNSVQLTNSHMTSVADVQVNPIMSSEGGALVAQTVTTTRNTEIYSSGQQLSTQGSSTNGPLQICTPSDSQMIPSNNTEMTSLGTISRNPDVRATTQNVPRPPSMYLGGVYPPQFKVPAASNIIRQGAPYRPARMPFTGGSRPMDHMLQGRANTTNQIRQRMGLPGSYQNIPRNHVRQYVPRGNTPQSATSLSNAGLPGYIRPTNYQGKSISCLAHAGKEYVLVEAIGKVFFPACPMKEFQHVWDSVLKIPCRALSRMEERAFIAHYGLPTSSLMCNKAVDLKLFDNFYPQLKYLFKDKYSSPSTTAASLPSSTISPRKRGSEMTGAQPPKQAYYGAGNRATLNPNTIRQRRTNDPDIIEIDVAAPPSQPQAGRIALSNQLRLRGVNPNMHQFPRGMNPRMPLQPRGALQQQYRGYPLTQQQRAMMGNYPRLVHNPAAGLAAGQAYRQVLGNNVIRSPSKLVASHAQGGVTSPRKPSTATVNDPDCFIVNPTPTPQDVICVD